MDHWVEMRLLLGVSAITYARCSHAVSVLHYYKHDDDDRRQRHHHHFISSGLNLDLSRMKWHCNGTNILTDIYMWKHDEQCTHTRRVRLPHFTYLKNFTFSHTKWNYSVQKNSDAKQQPSTSREKEAELWKSVIYRIWNVCLSARLHYLSIDFASHVLFVFCICACDMMMIMTTTTPMVYPMQPIWNLRMKHNILFHLIGF